MTQKFILEVTTGKGEEKETETTIIGEYTTQLDIEISANGQHAANIAIVYDVTSLSDKLAQKGGLLGAMDKVGQFAGKLGDKGIEDYYVEVSCDVIGTPMDPRQDAGPRLAGLTAWSEHAAASSLGPTLPLDRYQPASNASAQAGSRCYNCGADLDSRWRRTS